MPRGMNMHVTADDAVELRQLMDVADLEALRDGKIGVNDAIARSLLAKQIFNGVRLYLSASKLLASNADPRFATPKIRAHQ